MCVCVCVRGLNICTHRGKNISKNKQTKTHAHMCIHTYLHKYIHTYIYIYIDNQSKVFGHPQKFSFLILKMLFLMKQFKHQNI